MNVIPILEENAAQAWIDQRSGVLVDEEARDAVGPIIREVRERGDAALLELTERFDGVKPRRLGTDRKDLAGALDSITRERLQALRQAIQNIRCFHEAQRRIEQPVEVRPGIRVWRIFRPLERVGIYVPGGRAAYPSTVLMCAIPAQIAGCREVAVCSPPAPDGLAPEPVRAAAELLGIDRVIPIGGAQAIAALAFGTDSVPHVHKIFGPGNRYVTAAKELVYGAVDIDMPAGPSEIVVLADETANASWVAADLISQAEHAPDTIAVCITTDLELARAVASECARQLTDLPQAEAARASLGDSAICVAPDLDLAISWTNRQATEHLTLMTKDDDAILRKIDHAGSVFLGAYSPVSAGDYAAGSNHVLPTGRRARAWSALSLDDFGRWMQVQRLTREGLAGIADTVPALARWEGFEAHARAVEARFEVAS